MNALEFITLQGDSENLVVNLPAVCAVFAPWGCPCDLVLSQTSQKFTPFHSGSAGYRNN